MAFFIVNILSVAVLHGARSSQKRRFYGPATVAAGKGEELLRRGWTRAVLPLRRTLCCIENID